MRDNKPYYAVFISGFTTEDETLHFTKWLLKQQQQNQAAKPLWKRLRFRPCVLSGIFGKKLSDKWPYVITHDQGRKFARLALPPKEPADDRPPLIPDERAGLPTLKRGEPRKLSSP